MTPGRENVPALAIATIAAYAIKAAFSRLDPDELRFMTAPTQALVGAVTGMEFTYEDGYGYVALAHHLVIAKSCAGGNYLLAAFGLLATTLVPAVGGQARKLKAVAVALVSAYAVTVVVNAIRIAVGVALRDGGWEWGRMTPERVHRLAGIAVYLASLVGVHGAARRVAAAGGGSGLFAPLVAYLAVTIAIPLANGAASARPLLFAEHAAWIALVSLLAWGAGRWYRSAAPRTRSMEDPWSPFRPSPRCLPPRCP